MSSPRVITWTRVDFNKARASNRDGITHYLSLAKEIYDQTQRVIQETAAAGGVCSTVPPLSYEDAQQKAWSLFSGPGAGAGEKALSFAHAYWQSLKHPWNDLALADLAKAKAKARERNAEEERRLANLSRSIKSTFKVELAETEAVIHAESAKPEFSWEERVKASAAAILEVVEPEQVDEVQQVVASIRASDPRQQHLALEALKITLANATKAREQARAAAIYRQKQYDTLVERMQHLLSQTSKRASVLETGKAEEIEATIGRIRAKLEAGSATEADEEELQAISQQIDAEVRGEEILQAAVAELNKMGYVAVDVMQTLEANDITSVYLEDPNDPERLLLLQSSNSSGLLAGEIQRRTRSTGGAEERHADRTAQVRLCGALEHVEKALASRWQVKVHSETAPGAEPRVNTKVPMSRTRLRSVAQARARTLAV